MLIDGLLLVLVVERKELSFGPRSPGLTTVSVVSLWVVMQIGWELDTPGVMFENCEIFLG